MNAAGDISQPGINENTRTRILKNDEQKVGLTMCFDVLLAKTTYTPAYVTIAKQMFRPDLLRYGNARGRHEQNWCQ